MLPVRRLSIASAQTALSAVAHEVRRKIYAFRSASKLTLRSVSWADAARQSRSCARNAAESGTQTCGGRCHDILAVIELRGGGQRHPGLRHRVVAAAGELSIRDRMFARTTCAPKPSPAGSAAHGCAHDRESLASARTARRRANGRDVEVEHSDLGLRTDVHKLSRSLPDFERVPVP